jgi:DNA-binding transcriptional LysR family regulator
VALLSPLIAAFYQQQPLTRLHFTLNPSLLDWQRCWKGRPISCWGARRAAAAERLWLSSPGRAGAAAGGCPAASAGADTRPLSWRNLRRYRAVATGGGALLSDQETLTVCDAAGQLALLRMGLGWGYLPRYQVQGCWRAASLVNWSCAGSRLVSAPGSAGMTTCGLASKWWRETLLANSAIFTLYTEIV